MFDVLAGVCGTVVAAVVAGRFVAFAPVVNGRPLVVVGPTGVALGTFSAAVRGCPAAAPATGVSARVRWAATCWIACDCCLACALVVASSGTIWTPFAFANCEAGISIWVLLTF